MIKRTADLSDPKAVLAAITATNLKTIVGPVNWTGGGPVKNVSKTPLAGGQWNKAGGKYELSIVANPQHPDIPVGGKVKLLG